MSKNLLCLGAAVLGLMGAAAQAKPHLGGFLPHKVHLTVINETSDAYVRVQDLVHPHGTVLAPKGESLVHTFQNIIPGVRIRMGEHAEGPFQPVSGCVDHTTYLNRHVTIRIQDGRVPHCVIDQKHLDHNISVIE